MSDTPKEITVPAGALDPQSIEEFRREMRAPGRVIPAPIAKNITPRPPILLFLPWPLPLRRIEITPGLWIDGREISTRMVAFREAQVEHRSGRRQGPSPDWRDLALEDQGRDLTDVVALWGRLHPVETDK